MLTAHPRAYERCSDDQMQDIPQDIEVIRAPAWDSARHFAIAGRYPAFLTRPDRWLTWWSGAVLAGLGAIRRMKPDVIWSTYPIPTAHRIAATLAHLSSLPWIADFRDPMAQADYPRDPKTWQSFIRVEERAIRDAHFSTFTTPSAVRLYQERYPSHTDKIILLENGYDEETFASASAASTLVPGKLTLLHSGIVYPLERDPKKLFEALSLIRRDTPGLAAKLNVRFRAPVHETLLRRLASEFDVADLVEIAPPIAYREALTEMLGADGLLILQAANCNAQIPAKLYEYLRARRPIIALTDPTGDTAAVARGAGIEAIAPLDDASAIAELISRFASGRLEGTLSSEATILSASRQARTIELARMLVQCRLERKHG